MRRSPDRLGVLVLRVPSTSGPHGCTGEQSRRVNLRSVPTTSIMSLIRSTASTIPRAESRSLGETTTEWSSFARSVGGRGNHGFPQPWGLPVDLMWILVWMPTEACPTRGLTLPTRLCRRARVLVPDIREPSTGEIVASRVVAPSPPVLSAGPPLLRCPRWRYCRGPRPPPFQHGAAAGKGGAATPPSRPRPMHQVLCTNGFDADLSQTDPSVRLKGRRARRGLQVASRSINFGAFMGRPLREWHLLLVRR